MHFLELPPEIREEIYRPILEPDNYRHTNEDHYTTYNYRPALSSLFRINRQIYHEARRIFLEKNQFVIIGTPWEQAKDHVMREGRVPILADGEEANNFKDHSLTVTIDAPDYNDPTQPLKRFLIHVDDLPKFTTSWKYSDLDNNNILNPHLTLTLTLRDPRRIQEWEEPTLSKAVQSRLLLPFGVVKGLSNCEVKGPPEPYPSLLKELRETQATPHASPEACLAESIRLKDLGNVALQNGQYQQTLDYYTQAWLAIHIVVSGRRRSAHAEAWFNRILSEPPFTGQQGQLVRLLQRVRLVANTVLAYLKLEDWEMARFWGMRTINMMRTSIGLDEGESAARPEEEAMLHFVAANEMGKIYYRTALAYKELDDKSEARRLLKVAAIYLPRDQNVQKLIGECALRLG
ncbi:hypothetical protein MBLNU457_6565t1 [Dothideomycetes sp. NU457]